MAGVLDLTDVLELVVHRFNDGAFAQQTLRSGGANNKGDGTVSGSGPTATYTGNIAATAAQIDGLIELNKQFTTSGRPARAICLYIAEPPPGDQQDIDNLVLLAQNKGATLVLMPSTSACGIS
jgi:hypothetical protein